MHIIGREKYAAHACVGHFVRQGQKNLDSNPAAAADAVSLKPKISKTLIETRTPTAP